ncbi:MAG: hypothetical protein IH991_22390, partial [Planctomycetes bacterium]|nr:hypothetical protein [Planctomycetota bacterium]
GSSNTYFVAISSNAQLPTALNATFQAISVNSLVRLEPINSVERIVEEHIGFSGQSSGLVESMEAALDDDLHRCFAAPGAADALRHRESSAFGHDQSQYRPSS